MASNNCRKFLPNMFNKNKCQGCFKPKESHSAEALESSKIARKVSKCGYLFLNPDFDFNNPLQRTRRWQRRFFVLYDDGELTWSVDENIATIPQGTIDMNKCTDVYDSESKTGHEFSIGVSANNKTHFMKGTSKEEIRRWHDVLVMYPRSLKIKQKHKRNTTVVTTPVRAPGDMKSDASPEKESTPNGSSARPRGKRHHTTTDIASTLVQPIDFVRYEQERANNLKRDLQLLGLSRSHSEAYVNQRLCDEDNESEEGESGEESGSESEAPARPPPPDETKYPGSHDPQGYRSVRDLKHKGQDGVRKSSSMQDMLNDQNNGLDGGKLSEHKRSRDDIDVANYEIDNNDSLDMEGKQSKNLFESLTTPDRPALVKPVPSKVLPYKEFASVPKVKHIENYVSSEEEPERRRSLPGGVEGKQQVDSALNELRNRPHGGSFREPKSPSPIRNYGFSVAVTPQNLDDTSPRNRFSSKESLGALKLTNDTDGKKKLRVLRIAPYLLDKDGNFVKKGWLVKRGDSERDWCKHWFVLSGSGLRYYKDAMAEENNLLDGRIDLSTGEKVTSVDVSRSYGFEIQTGSGTFILSAMTQGIRRNWIEAIENCIQMAKSSSHHSNDGTAAVSVEYSKDFSSRSDEDRVTSRPVDDEDRLKQGVSKRVSAPPTLKTDTRVLGGRYPARSTDQVKHIEDAMTEARSVSRRRSSSTDSSDLTIGHPAPSATSPSQQLPSSQQHKQASPHLTTDDERADIPSTLSSEDKQAIKDVEKSIRQLNRRSSGTAQPASYKPRHLDKFELGETYKDSSVNTKEADDMIDREVVPPVESSSRLYQRKHSASHHHKSPAMMSPSERLLARSRSGSPRPKSPPLEASVSDEVVFSQSDSTADTEEDRSLSDSSTGKSTKAQMEESRKQLQVASDSGEKVLVDLLEAEVETLKAQLEKAQEQVSQLQDDNVGLKTQLNAGQRSHRESLDDFATDSTRYIAQMIEMQEEADFAFQYIQARLCSCPLPYDSQVQTLKRQVSDSNDIINRQQTEIGALQGKLQLSNSQLTEVESALEQTTKNWNGERANVKKLTSDLQQAKRQNITKDEDIMRLRNKLERADRLCKERTESMEKLRKDLEEKTKTVSDVTKDVAQLRTINSKFQEKCSKLQSVEKLLKENTEKLRSSESYHKTKVKEVQSGFEMERKQLNEKIRSLEQRIERFQKQSNIVDSLNVDMADILREKDETIAELEDKLSDSLKETSDLTAELESVHHGETVDSLLQERVSVMQTHVTSLEKELTDLRIENVRLKKNVLQQSEQLETSDGECSRLTDEMMVLLDDYHLGNGHENVSSAISDLVYTRHVESMTSFESVSEEYGALKGKYDKCFQAVKLLQARLQKSQLEYREIESAYNALRQQSDLIEGKLTTLNEDMSSLMSDSAIECGGHGKESPQRLQGLIAQCRTVMASILSGVSSMRMDEKTDAMKDIEKKLTQVNDCLKLLCLSQEKYVPDVQAKLRNYAEKLSLEAVCLGQLAYLTRQKQAVQRNVREFDDAQCQIEELQSALINEQADSEVQKNRLRALQQDNLVTYASLLADKMVVMGELEMVIGQVKQKQENVMERLSEISASSVLSREASIRTDISEALFSDNGDPTESLVTRAVVEGEVTYMMDQIHRRGSVVDAGREEVEELKRQLETVQHKLEERDERLERLMEGGPREGMVQLAAGVAHEVTQQALDRLDNRQDVGQLKEVLRGELEKAFEDLHNKNVQDRNAMNEKPPHVSQFADMLAQQAVIAGQVAYLSKRVCNVSSHHDQQKGDSNVHSKRAISITDSTSDSAPLSFDVLSSGLVTQATQRALASQRLETYTNQGFSDEGKLESKIGKLAKSLTDIEQELSPHESSTSNYAGKLAREIIFQAELSYMLYRVKVHYDEEIEQIRQSQTSGSDFKQGLDVDSLRKELTDAELAVEKVSREKSRLNEEYCTKMEELEDEIEQLRSRHQKELDESKADMRMVLKSVRASERSAEDELVKTIKDLQHELDQEREKHKAEIELLSSRLRSRSESEEVTMLQERLEEVERELKDVQDEYEDELVQQRVTYEKDLEKLREEVLSLRASAEASNIQVDDDFMRKRYEKEIDTLKGLCGQGSVDTERSYRKVMQELREQHKQEMEQLRRDKDQLLEEESRATQAALEALKKVNEAELAKEKKRFEDLASKMFSDKDVDTIEQDYKQEIDMIRSEMKLLSEQYSIKCIENATLAGKLETQGKTLQQSRSQISQLSARNEEMHSQLVGEIEKLKKSFATTHEPGSSDSKQVHDLKVTLQLKEVETKELKEEIKLLKEHLQAAEEDNEHHHHLHDQYQSRLSQHEDTLRRLGRQLEQVAAGRQPRPSLHRGSPVVKHRQFKELQHSPRSRSPSPPRPESPQRQRQKQPRGKAELMRSKSSPGIPRHMLSAAPVPQLERKYSMDDSTSRLSRYDQFRQTGGISVAERLKKFEV